MPDMKGGKAVVEITGDRGPLDKTLNGAEKSLQKFGANTRKIGLALGAAGAAILAPIGLAVKKFAAAGDELHKMSLRTGVAVESLGRLRFMAEQSGASLGTVEKGIKKMQKTIVDAGFGLSTATDGLDMLGLSLEELQGLDPEAQFMKMGRAIAAVEDPTQRAAAAQMLLGRAGTELLPLFAAGADGMAELAAKADQLAHWTTEDADAAARLTDAGNELKTALGGLGQMIAVVLAPVLSSILETVSAVIGKVAAWAKAHPTLTTVLVASAVVLGTLLTVGGAILILLPTLSSAFGILGISINACIWPVTLIVAAIAAAIAIGVLLVKNWDKVSAAAKAVGEAVVKAFKWLGEKVAAALGALWTALKWWYVELPRKFFGWGASLINSLVKGIISKIRAAVNAVRNVGKKIWAAFKRVLRISSPSRVFYEMGENIGEGLRLGIEGSLQGITANANISASGAGSPLISRAATTIVGGRSGPTVHIGVMNVGGDGRGAARDLMSELRRQGWAVTR